MTVTPLHYPVAYVLHKLHKKLNLPGLTVGTMFPDLEVPILFLLIGTDRLVLHSLLGAATIGTLLSVTFAIMIYPILISYLFGIDEEKVKEKTRLSLSLIVSCLLGKRARISLFGITLHSKLAKHQLTTTIPVKKYKG